jgi:hypothetical protein
MKLFATCMPCQRELGHPSFEPFFVPYYEDRIAQIQCSRGHNSVVVIQSQKFEVLLESGANALLAGFTLEAATTFSAALERFNEFSTKAMLLHQGLSIAAYEQMFKEMARQSERQYGSFVALHALVLDAPYVPNKQIAPFRNSVIHKGEIPTPDAARQFCEDVYSEIYRTASLLRQHCEAAVRTAILDDLRARQAKVPAGMSVATAANMGLYSLSWADNKADFSEALQRYAKGAEMLLASESEMRRLHESLFPREP